MSLVDADTGEVIEVVPLDVVGTDQDIRRERIDLDHFARLVLAVEDLPPIVLRRGDDGRLSVIDGTHRLAARRRTGRATITARITLDHTTPPRT